MNRLLIISVFILACAAAAQAQGPSVAIKTVTTLPGTCRANAQYTEVVFKKADDTTRGFYTCASNQTSWSGPYASSGGATPGTVTSVSVVSANGMAGTVATATTTPAITLTTSVTGVPVGNGTAFSASNVTNDAQTKAAIVPNTAPSAGQVPCGNAGGTAYAPCTIGTDATLASTGALTLASVISAGGPTGSATVAPIITYDVKGRLTTVSSATITPAVGSITGLGTGVGTALAVNVGTAGSPVLNGGALGSPSSAGTIPAFTLGGTISGGGNQLNNIIIGTTTPLAGSFTTLQTSGNVKFGTSSTGNVLLSTSGTAYIYDVNASAIAQLASDNYKGTYVSTFTDTTSVTNNTIANRNMIMYGLSSRFGMAANVVVGFVASGDAAGSLDTGISRDSAGVIAFGTGAAGSTAGSIKAATATFNALSSDATHTDNTVCADSSSGLLYKGTGTLGICLGTSSSRFKKEIKPLAVGLPEIMRLRPISYRTDAQHGDSNKTLYGFTAERGGQVLPALMAKDDKGLPNTFDYLGVVPVLVKAMQDQQEMINDLKAAVARQQKQIQRLRHLRHWN